MSENTVPATLKVSQLKADPANVRSGPAGVKELASSIAELGVLQPLLALDWPERLPSGLDLLDYGRGGEADDEDEDEGEPADGEDAFGSDADADALAGVHDPED